MGTPLLNISLKEPENFLKNSAPSACRCSIFVKFRVKSAAYSQPVCSRLTIESHYLLQICFSFASDFRIFQSVSLNSAVLPFPSSTVSKLCRLATLQFRISAVSQSCCVATVLTNSSIFLNNRTAGKTAGGIVNRAAIRIIIRAAGNIDEPICKVRLRDRFAQPILNGKSAVSNSRNKITELNNVSTNRRNESPEQQTLRNKKCPPRDSNPEPTT